MILSNSMAMSEERFDAREAYSPKQSLSRLVPGVGNSTIEEALTLFQQEGMKGPQAARHILSLFEAIPNPHDDLGLLQAEEGKKTKTIFDQTGWAYANPNALTPKQRESLPVLATCLIRAKNSPKCGFCSP